MSPRRVARRPDAEPRKSVQLRTAIVTMAVTSVLTVLLLVAYLNSGCPKTVVTLTRPESPLWRLVPLGRGGTIELCEPGRIASG